MVSVQEWQLNQDVKYLRRGVKKEEQNFLFSLITLIGIIHLQNNRKLDRLHLKKKQKLLKNKEFQKVFAQNNRYVGRFMVLWIGDTNLNFCRAGIIASKKTGNAIKRNKAKRLLREAFRQNQKNINLAADLVIVARSRIINAHLNQISEELLSLTNKVNIK
jgi:ribonuclease P protein component